MVFEVLVLLVAFGGGSQTVVGWPVWLCELVCLFLVVVQWCTIYFFGRQSDTVCNGQVLKKNGKGWVQNFEMWE
jgi:hypothetical protein